MKSENKNKKGLVFMGMGFELLALILTALYVGKYIDDHYQTGGLVMAGLSFLALIIWMYHLIILTKQFRRNND